METTGMIDNCSHEILDRIGIFNFNYECRDCGERFMAEKWDNAH